MRLPAAAADGDGGVREQAKVAGVVGVQVGERHQVHVPWCESATLEQPAHEATGGQVLDTAVIAEGGPDRVIEWARVVHAAVDEHHGLAVTQQEDVEIEGVPTVEPHLVKDLGSRHPLGPIAKNIHGEGHREPWDMVNPVPRMGMLVIRAREGSRVSTLVCWANTGSEASMTSA